MATAGEIFRKRGAAVRYRIRLSDYDDIWREIKNKIMAHEAVSKRGVWLWSELMGSREPAEKLNSMAPRVAGWMDEHYPFMICFSDIHDQHCPRSDDDDALSFVSNCS